MNHAHRGFSTADRVCLIVKNARVRWRMGSDLLQVFADGDHLPVAFLVNISLAKKQVMGFVNHAKQTRVTWPDYNVGLHRHSHVRTYVLYLLACLTEAGEATYHGKFTWRYPA